MDPTSDDIKATPTPLPGEGLILTSLEAENEALRQENQGLKGRLAGLEIQLDQAQAWKSSWLLRFLFEGGRKVRALKAAVVLLGMVLLFTPPVLVYMERWAEKPGLRDSFYNQWCSVEWLCQTSLPSYMLVIFICVGLFILLFLALAPSSSQAFLSGVKIGESPATLSEISRGQHLSSQILQAAAALLAVGSLSAAIFWGRLPGAEVLLAALLYLVGRLLLEWPLRSMWGGLRQIPGWVWVFLLAQGVLILFLQSLYSTHRLTILLGGLLALVLVWLFALRKRVSPAAWVMLLALVVFTWRIDSWQYAAIGDEYDFFTFARYLATEVSPIDNLANLFHGQAVYGAHPYFSSLIQAFFMRLLGVDNFGWRFSSLYLAAAAVVFFYLFFRIFVNRRVAFLSAFLLACSHYLMSFGKIGYNNLQALFAFSLAMWLAGEAVRTKRRIAYTALGLTLGLCFYVYPAALYVLPIPLLLLLFYDLPIRKPLAEWKPVVGRWGLIIAPLSLLVMPLLFQSGYWAEKLPGTFLNNAEIVTNGVGSHVAVNLLYSFFSFLYVPEESHFVVSSYIDPLSGALLILGLAWMIQMAFKHRFPRFFLLAYAAFLFLVGASHDRQFPANTRMFMLLPFFTLLSAAGLQWCLSRIEGWWRPAFPWQVHGKQIPVVKGILGLALVGLLSVNLYQAYVLVRQRTTGTGSLEVIFMRLLQRDRERTGGGGKIFLFLTEEDWGIDGLRLMHDVYGLPPSQAQLDREVVDNTALSPALVAKIQNPNMVVIVQPWMEETLRADVEAQLVRLGKWECPVQDVPWSEPRFSLWSSQKWRSLCPIGGLWN